MAREEKERTNIVTRTAIDDGSRTNICEGWCMDKCGGPDFESSCAKIWDSSVE